MEKAGKKVNEIEIEFQDGSVKKLSEISEGKILGLKFDGKEKDGKFSSFTCKKGVVSDNGHIYIERRIFQNADMPEGVCYDLPLPLTEAEFQKIPLEKRLTGFAKSERVDNDAIKAGKGQGTPNPEKDANKFLASLEKTGVPKAKIEAIKKAMLAAGFAK